MEGKQETHPTFRNTAPFLHRVSPYRPPNHAGQHKKILSWRTLSCCKFREAAKPYSRSKEIVRIGLTSTIILILSGCGGGEPPEAGPVLFEEIIQVRNQYAGEYNTNAFRFMIAANTYLHGSSTFTIGPITREETEATAKNTNINITTSSSAACLTITDTTYTSTCSYTDRTHTIKSEPIKDMDGLDSLIIINSHGLTSFEGLTENQTYTYHEITAGSLASATAYPAESGIDAINGIWDFVSFPLTRGRSLTPELKGLYTCTNHSCSGDMGLIINRYKYKVWAGDMIHTNKTKTFAGIISPDNRVMSIIACPKPFNPMDNIDECRVVHATRNEGALNHIQ